MIESVADKKHDPADDRPPGGCAGECTYKSGEWHATKTGGSTIPDGLQYGGKSHNQQTAPVKKDPSIAAQRAQAYEMKEDKRGSYRSGKPPWIGQSPTQRAACESQREFAREGVISGYCGKQWRFYYHPGWEREHRLQGGSGDGQRDENGDIESHVSPFQAVNTRTSVISARSTAGTILAVRWRPSLARVDSRRWPTTRPRGKPPPRPEVTTLARGGGSKSRRRKRRRRGSAVYRSSIVPLWCPPPLRIPRTNRFRAGRSRFHMRRGNYVALIRRNRQVWPTPSLMRPEAGAETTGSPQARP